MSVSLDELSRRTGIRPYVLEEILRDELRSGRVCVDRQGRYQVVLACFAPALVDALRGLAVPDPDESCFVFPTDGERRRKR